MSYVPVALLNVHLTETQLVSSVWFWTLPVVISKAMELVVNITICS